MTPNHPKWIIKFIHKSKVSAVKIVEWENHHEVATVPNVYTFNGEESDGKKAANLISTAPELLEALEILADSARHMEIAKNNPSYGFMESDWQRLAVNVEFARKVISKAKGE